MCECSRASELQIRPLSELKVCCTQSDSSTIKTRNFFSNQITKQFPEMCPGQTALDTIELKKEENKRKTLQEVNLALLCRCDLQVQTSIIIFSSVC